MRGLWRCPERLSYALAAESGMCSGTGSVFSTGLWWISVHLDNRVVRSLGWHSTSVGHKLAHADHKVSSFSLLPLMHRHFSLKCWCLEPRVCEMEAINGSAADACFIFCLPGDLCLGRGKGPWSAGILWYRGGQWGWGDLGGHKSALLVFDPGQHYTRGHRMTAAVHLVEAQPPSIPT